MPIIGIKKLVRKTNTITFITFFQNHIEYWESILRIEINNYINI